jgi:hypothetical protein
MKKKSLFLVVSSLVFFCFVGGLSAQKPAKTLTLLYGNNINAEIDPCPT